MKLISKSLRYVTPPKATIAYEFTYYGKATGLDKVRIRFLDVADDMFDGGSIAFSKDNGKTWGDERPQGAAVKTPKGIRRTFEGLSFIDPGNGLLLVLYLEGLFTGMSWHEGLQQYYLKYRVSKDGAHSYMVDEQVIQRDPPGKPGTYGPTHPCEHVWVGKNAMYMPASQSMVRTKAGHLCISVFITSFDADGKLYNPGNNYTWSKQLILLGHWRPDGSGHIDWELGPTLGIAVEKSTRGLDESAMALLPDGRLLLVIRGSNGGSTDPRVEIPGRKWYSISSDHGRTWSEVKPWTYHDGAEFYSPASMCTITHHSNGKTYWFGNISPGNTFANHPRFPIVGGEIDPESGLLRRDTLFVVETWQPGEPQYLQLTAHAVHEDRVTGELILEMPRICPVGDTATGDTYEYRIGV